MKGGECGGESEWREVVCRDNSAEGGYCVASAWKKQLKCTVKLLIIHLHVFIF